MIQWSCLPSTFAPSKSFSQQLNVSSKNHIYTETFILEFPNIEGWFTDQNFMPLEIEERMNLSLVINGMSV